MACPLCGDDCHCHAPHAAAARTGLRASFHPQQEHKSQTTVASDDDLDRSEEQFAASLDEEQFGSATLSELRGRAENQPDSHDEPDYRAKMAERAATGIERRMAEERVLEQQSERWRDEVASRIEGYKQKRSRKQLSGEFSMRFDWEQPSHGARVAQAAAAEPAWDEPEPLAAQPEPPVESPSTQQARTLVEPEPERLAAILDEAAALIEAAQATIPQARDGASLPPPKPPEPVPARRLRHANLIEFPRLPFMPPPPDELAEPMMDKPRILDVPDEIVQEMADERTPLGDIALESLAEETPRKTEFDVPPQVASLALRFAAAMVDAVIVGSATAVCLAAGTFMVKVIPHNRMTLAVVLAVPTVLWAIYQYVFLVYGAATPGMRMTHLQVRGFTGEPSSRNRRRCRALAMVMSLMAMGIGLFWALADDDMLCWHDRITRTYLARG